MLYESIISVIENGFKSKFEKDVDGKRIEVTLSKGTSQLIDYVPIKDANEHTLGTKIDEMMVRLNQSINKKG